MGVSRALCCLLVDDDRDSEGVARYTTWTQYIGNRNRNRISGIKWDWKTDIRHRTENEHMAWDHKVSGTGKWDMGYGIWEAQTIRVPSQQRMSPAREHSFHFSVSTYYDTQTHSLEEEQLLLDRT